MLPLPTCLQHFDHFEQETQDRKIDFFFFFFLRPGIKSGLLSSVDSRASPMIASDFKGQLSVTATSLITVGILSPALYSFPTCVR